MGEKSLRSLVDEITLEVAHAAEGERTAANLQKAIADRAFAHIQQLIVDRTLIDAPDIDRVTEAIVCGVLERLKQIAEGGGQIGRA
jgi:NTP pyrophosphatase (non-canonical NTP hydrolase)